MAEDNKVNEVRGARTHAAQEAKKAGNIARREARQVGSQANMQEAQELMIFNPLKMRKNFEPLNKRTERPPEGQKGQKTEKEAKEPSNVERVAANYYAKNPELQKKTLMSLHQEIKPDDSHEKILEKLQKIYADKSLADEAIDFLIEVSENKEALKKKYIGIKEDFNAQYGRQIQAGHNIRTQAQQFSKKGLGSPTALRDLYREITGNPRTPKQLFDELTAKFQFSDMKNIIDFILHSLGDDMKAKGPSIAREELKRLFSETRSMQAILGLFRFFFARMGMIKKQFDQYDLSMPSRVNYEVLARLLMKLLEERYPTPDKILKQSFVLGIAEELAAQIIVYTQYRDAMRHISPMLFKSERHRQEVLMALMETLSDLEDEIDEEEE
ncbi:HrpJ domain-containing protein [Candidatus Neptunochlamydia vexilliferae]|uniref:Hypersensitivity response secretion-like HrpJ domain-containing protein n=1 Tax=Candidatus Neptunichlamydia vexilliferae TaxID=1651774 RepID=A0ABS0AWP2_9BACT|nr:HrpJ domain-containing protein [Candidatus Neptunochlamydia vexilliferae]MBF5058541.1 hypothetical protein [Candidatus Neptunochlamydia vexilliferae]